MATITTQSIIDKAEIVLHDTSNVRWAVTELLGWLNDGQRAIVSARPDANVKSANLLLVQGTKQTIPSDGWQLVNVVRNTGADGATPGRAVRYVQRELMDRQMPDWHAASASSVTEHYMYDTKTPKVFWVYPPSEGLSRVELFYSVPPADATINGTISIDDIYQGPLLDYVLYRAYSKDYEAAGAAERAVAHYQAFEQGLGLKAQADASAMPRAA